MKNLVLTAAATLLLFGFSSKSSADFLVYSNGSGLANCEDQSNGGRRSAELVRCDDVGQGRNHSCSQVGNGCLAQEGKGNGGNAKCAATCSEGGRRPQRPPPPPPPPQRRGGERTFNVSYSGSPYTRCDDRSTGGRPGARVVACNDIAHGRNHRCDNVGSACLAVEGSGNNGNAACDAICQ